MRERNLAHQRRIGKVIVAGGVAVAVAHAGKPRGGVKAKGLLG